MDIYVAKGQNSERQRRWLDVKNWSRIIVVMLRACGMLVRYREYMKKIKTKLYGEKILQSTMFSRKKLQNSILNQINI